MFTGYTYEVWKGDKQIGTFYNTCLLMGPHFIFPTVPLIKEAYNSPCEYIKVPLKIRVISNNGIECTTRVVLDVTKKSARQIKLLLK